MNAMLQQALSAERMTACEQHLAVDRRRVGKERQRFSDQQVRLEEGAQCAVTQYHG